MVITMLKMILLSCLIGCGQAYADEKTDICDSVVTIYRNSVEMSNNNIDLQLAIAAATHQYNGSPNGYDVVLYVISKGYHDAVHKNNIDEQSVILKNTCINTWLKDNVDDNHDNHDYQYGLYMS